MEPGFLGFSKGENFNAVHSMIFWDPAREVCSYSLPILGRPVLWYGLFFALGFFLGYILFFRRVRNYCLDYPLFLQEEIRKEVVVEHSLQDLGIERKKGPLIDSLNSWLVKEGDPLQKRQKLESVLKGSLLRWKDRSKLLAEKALLYALVGVVVGARVIDVFLYQDFTKLIEDPFSLIRVWEGGLASHGGALGAIVGLFFFFKKRHSQLPMLSFWGLLDFVCIPSAVIASCIRIGNFFNQEILGVCTTLPFGVIFGHPADGGPVCPRHPVQIYEALFYFCTIAVLSLYGHKKKVLRQGQILGLFLFLVFGFRLLIESLKVEQSVWLATGSFFTMGQVLSIPFLLLGGLLLFRKRGPSILWVKR